MSEGAMPTPAENLCDVADTIRGRLSEINDGLDRLESRPSDAEKAVETVGLEGMLNTCRAEAERAKSRLDAIVQRIGHL